MDLRISLISSRLISLGTTARIKPAFSSALKPSGEFTLHCVEACSLAVGKCVCMIFARPKSCTINASTPSDIAASTVLYASSLSLSDIRILSARYTLTSLAWQYSTAFFSSSNVKFAAPLRAFIPFAPRYTAFAPHLTAAVNASVLPAGAKISVLFIVITIAFRAKKWTHFDCVH